MPHAMHQDDFMNRYWDSGDRVLTLQWLEATADMTPDQFNQGMLQSPCPRTLTSM
ncbi:MAG: hypothetical protein ACI9WU_002142 [Myxococcota bacterium]|jgi:hypothetical protein